MVLQVLPLRYRKKVELLVEEEQQGQARYLLVKSYLYRPVGTLAPQKTRSLVVVLEVVPLAVLD